MIEYEKRNFMFILYAQLLDWRILNYLRYAMIHLMFLGLAQVDYPIVTKILPTKWPSSKIDCISYSRLTDINDL